MEGQYNKVYILAPYNYHTGGVELAHQLIHKLNNLGQEAYIVYVENGKISQDQMITPVYADYNIKTTNIIEDDEKNIVILPEIYFDYIYWFKRISIGCWWMSVDNRYSNSNGWDMFRFHKNIKKKIKGLYIQIMKPHKISDTEIIHMGDRIIHFYQSTYAQNHLLKKGFRKVLPLGDYINNNLIDSDHDYISKKKDIVIYNPAKGWNFTQKIIKKNPTVTFIPLKGLNKDKLLSTLQQAKVYIDFGNFPGKDRLSREAVMNHNIIITGNLGASKYYEDVPIASKYKFEVKDSNLNDISKLIRCAIQNYELMTSDFDNYRKHVSMEENEFENQILTLFFK